MQTKQQTLSSPISFSGKGLHTGVKVNMTVLPAPENSGIRFMAEVADVGKNYRMLIVPADYLTDNNITDEQIDNALNLFLDPLPAEREAMLRELKEEYRLYLLSNNNPISFTHINKEFEQNYGYQFKELFIEMFCSYKMNMSKPSEKIFLKALSIAGANSGETLFIDDSPANIEAAAGLGFITCLYDVEKPFTEQVRRALANG